jgi:hypothetical protein
VPSVGEERAHSARAPQLRAVRQSAGLGLGVAGNAVLMLFILWLIAVVLVIWGIVSLVRGEALTGVVLIVVGLLVGPGGVSVFA